MAETFKIPDKGEVIDSDWRDDIDLAGIEYEEFKQEADYVLPETVKRASVKRAKNKRIGHEALFGINDRIAA